jgi:quercetin dioxygenase-like cupin family protein
MATRILENPVTGERFVFSDEGTDPDGRVRFVRYELRPGARGLPHRHPGHVQTFRVVSGRLHVRLDGRSLLLQPGDTAACSPGGVHQQWNEGPQTAVVEESFDPPLDIEPLFVVLARAAERDALLPNGVLRNRLKFGVLFHDFSHVVAPAYRGLAPAIRVLAALGRLRGYERWYTEDLPHRTPG